MFLKAVHFQKIFKKFAKLSADGYKYFEDCIWKCTSLGKQDFTREKLPGLTTFLTSQNYLKSIVIWMMKNGKINQISILFAV